MIYNPRQLEHQTHEVYDSASSVMLAPSSDVIRNHCVENNTEWRFVLPRFSLHIIHLSQFIGKMVSVCNEDKTTNSVKRFYHEELDLSKCVGLPYIVTTQQVINGFCSDLYPFSERHLVNAAFWHRLEGELEMH